MDWEQIRKDEKALLEKEFGLHRWYQSPLESDSWRSTKTFLSVIVSSTLGFGAYSYLNLIYNMSGIAIIIGIGILIVGLFLNQNIRTAFYALITKQSRNVLKIQKTARYYFLEGNEDILFIQTEDKIAALGIYEIKAIPLMIIGNLERFMRLLYQQNTPIFWAYMQAPLESANPLSSLPYFQERAINYETPASDEFSQPEATEAMNQQIGEVHVFFGIRKTFKITEKRARIYQEVSSNLFDIGTLFQSAYPHVILALLKNQELHGAFNLITTCGALAS